MACRGESMGFGFGFEDPRLEYKRKFRWLFKIRGVSALDYGGEIRALPHRRGSRPKLKWKELECQHINETIYFPFKPEWEPIQLHLYDLRCNINPVFDWIKKAELQAQGSSGLYDPQKGKWTPVVDSGFKRSGELVMLGGCGDTLENWMFEGCYPQNIDWGELDMDNSDIVTVDLTLRYDRAYFLENN